MSDQINAFIQREVKEWSEFVTYRLAREISRQKGMTVSRDEIFDINRAVVQALKGNAHEVGFQFAEAGRFIDMKNIKYKGEGSAERGQEFIEKLKAWVERIGVDQFRYVPGYNAADGIPDEKAITRIALGIFFNKMEASDTHKRKKWWSHVVYGGLGNLYARLISKYTGEAVNTVKKMQP